MIYVCYCFSSKRFKSKAILTNTKAGKVFIFRIRTVGAVNFNPKTSFLYASTTHISQ